MDEKTFKEEWRLFEYEWEGKVAHAQDIARAAMHHANEVRDYGDEVDDLYERIEKLEKELRELKKSK